MSVYYETFKNHVSIDSYTHYGHLSQQWFSTNSTYGVRVRTVSYYSSVHSIGIL